MLNEIESLNNWVKDVKVNIKMHTFVNPYIIINMHLAFYIIFFSLSIILSIFSIAVLISSIEYLYLAE